ncbi:MAG: YHS domain-containing protein [Chloroflexi bacterium]|nr:YHS domain-containing protein [Chloroflexota bacterium]
MEPLINEPPGRPTLSIEDLAARAGESVGQLREWHALGLIGKKGANSFALEDVEIARLIQLCLRRGISIDALSRIENEQGSFIRRYLETLYPPGFEPRYSLEEAAAEARVDIELTKRLWSVCGLHEPTDLLNSQDVAFFRSCKAMLEAGLPEDALFQGLRVYADSLARVAEAESRLFHFYVNERLKAGGLSGTALTEQRLAAMDGLQPHMEPTLRYFHRKGFMQAIRQDVVLHLAEEEHRDGRRSEGQMEIALAFVDLSSFTPLAEAMGDDVAADVLRRFSELVRTATHALDGRVVKQIGDSFMLVFPEPRAAVMAALDIDRRAADEPQFPAVRTGVHWGSVLYREGDYVGATVNLASRLTSEARPHQVLVTAAVHREVQDLPNVEFLYVGKRHVKGVSRELELFDARMIDTRASEKETDPVCGMELAPTEVSAQLTFEGRNLAFCSEACLKTFVGAPKRYPPASTPN